MSTTIVLNGAGLRRSIARVPEDPEAFWLNRMDADTVPVARSNFRRWMRWGHVWAAEIVPELAEFGRRNEERLGYADRATFLEADASEGLEAEGPLDLIIVTSAAPEISIELMEHVKLGGTLLIPVGGAHFYQELIRVRKGGSGRVTHENLGGVAFVPMTGKRGWNG